MGGPLSGVVRWLLWAAARLGARIRTFAALDFAALSAVGKRHPRWSSSIAADSAAIQQAGDERGDTDGLEERDGKLQWEEVARRGSFLPARKADFIQDVPVSGATQFDARLLLIHPCIAVCSAEREREGEPIL